jgi:hypothetical protein
LKFQEILIIIGFGFFSFPNGIAKGGIGYETPPVLEFDPLLANVFYHGRGSPGPKPTG